MTQPYTKYLSVTEFSEQLSAAGWPFEPATIRYWIRTKRLKATRVGLQRYAIPESEVQRVLAEMTPHEEPND